jgi:uncharacterized protein
VNLTIYDEHYAICRLSPDAAIPAWAKGDFVSVTRTKDELSVVCAEANVPSDIQAGRNWCLIQVEGPMDLSIVGVLASLTKPLADADINLFAVATYDTDYLLVPEEKLEAAKVALEHAGHQFVL